ncbi:Rap1-interacting factor 1 N terminal-domain-containing protein [Lasiosphaeria hispida]|uniref:Rap1-interacting factor 1 N terminal-domain-containing protein n=1 Tax=Lasiosphaeria hispida TaxID=260671 RepID=A0AAJ0M841_9PEZI|nr:Rap1-interacting factor 1 N terminal-domain-containing protein [Lasiosphaeria hispida]
MSTEVVMPNILESLPPRPPTPPRETQNEALAAKLVLRSVDTRLAIIHTPPGIHSPGDSIPTNSTIHRSRKKVEFSAKAEYKEPPVHLDGHAKGLQPTPVSLPRSAQKPVKSILKVTHYAPNPLGSSNGEGFDPSDPNSNLSTMLESTLQQLAGGDRESKTDAYTMLTRACRASNNLPDRVALHEKMGLFTQFIQRDIMSRSQDGVADTSLVNHALSLLITFLGMSSIASTISNEFGVFIIDHCIRSFEDPTLTKEVARHLMHVISLQNFSAKVMTSDRVGRLVSSLHNLSDHIKGKTIVNARVHIYKKLVKQSRQLMVIHSDWLFDMFTDMTSNLRETRTAAISLGLEAAFSIGHEKQLSRKVNEMFNNVTEEGRYIQYFEKRLKALSKDKNDPEVVPRIWSVAVLLLRNPKVDASDPLLYIIQSCFNNPETATKIAANHAWSRFVFLIHLNEQLFSRKLSTLLTPLISQLKRKSSGRQTERQTEDLRKAVLDGINNLLYYTFKPNLNPALLDAYWEGSVKPIVATLVELPAQGNVRQASLILGGLFDCMTPRRWRDDHVVESPMVSPEELPPIDPKWIRRNASMVLTTVQLVLNKDFLALADESSATYKLWQVLVVNVASAASKEIKVSKDTVVFVTEAFNVLQKIWKRGVPTNVEGQSTSVQFLLAVRTFLEAMINCLGLLPFTEKPGKNQVLAKAPLYILFSMLSALPPGIPDDDEFAQFFSSVFAPFFVSKAGDKARMDLAQELLAVIPMEAPRPYGPWLLVAGKIVSWLGSGQNSHQSTASGNETPVGHEYREIVKVLERGIRSTPQLPWERWESLFWAVYERTRDETGDAGVAIVAIEPLAKALLDQLSLSGTGSISASNVQCVTELLSVATQPRDRQAVDAARRRLWGTALAGSRSASFDTFDHLYKVVSEALKCMYQEFDSTDPDAAVNLLRTVVDFLGRCNPQLFSKALIGLQDGVLPWIHDTKRLLGSQTSAVFAVTKSLWDKLSLFIADLEQPEQQLEYLERFFCSSFDSSHRYIVNSSVSLWNKLFENVEHMEYPEQLKAALAQIQPYVDIILPGLDLSGTDFAGQQPMFIDSVDELSLPNLRSAGSSRRETPQQPSSTHKRSPEPSSLSRTKKRPNHSTPKNKFSGAHRHTTPRLRHDDSQLQFAPIEPSPLGKHQMESQVLTERQKEVRERQKENATLFPDIRSSPAPKSKDKTPFIQPQESTPKHSSQVREATTPEPGGAFDSFVSSTPTPRRGQPVAIPEHDMVDLPSSPPEPRGNPLAAEIRSRSASNSLLEDWHFSSSPVGSPNPSRQALIPETSGPENTVDEDPLPESEKKLPSPHDDDVEERQTELESSPEEDEVVEDTILPDYPSVVPVPDTPKQPAAPVPAPAPTTPRRRTRSSQLEETPKSDTKSDTEVFVDAPSSPLLPSPKRSERIAKSTKASRLRDSQSVQSQTPSLASDGDDRSMIRLVIELDAGKADRSEYKRPSASPDKNAVKVPILDCIVVGDSPEKLSKRLRASRASSAASMAPSTTEAELIPSSQPQAKEGGRQKRKRASSKANESTARKRRHHSPVKQEDGTSEVPDSQPEVVEGGTKANQIFRGQSATPSVHNSEPVPGEETDFQDSESYELVDPMEIESSQRHDLEVQSQIVLESRGQNSQREQGDAADAMQVDTNQPSTNEREVEAPSTAPAPASAPPTGYMSRIMSLLRNSLSELRSARMSREEVYQVEDVFMDMKRELYEAERRGRE